MSNRGIIVGTDRGQEWLLPWWWQHYSAHNTLPVLFIDFGMSERAAAWCKKRGEYMPLKGYEKFVLRDELILPEKRKVWEEACCGTAIWHSRSGWFKKPFALLQSPFPEAVWIDLDCEVKANIEPIFDYLTPGIEIALKRETDRWHEKVKALDCLLSGEIIYNSGVIVFRKGAKIIDQWVEAATHHNEEFMGDQEALSRTIFTKKPPLAELPDTYNWNMYDGHNEEAVICHYLSFLLKMTIVKEIFRTLEFG